MCIRDSSSTSPIASIRKQSLATRSPVPSPVAPASPEMRIRDRPWFAYLKESYLLYSRWLEDAIYATEDVDPQQRRRAGFWTRQWLDALAPTNFFWTNPEALNRAHVSQGVSVLQGWQHWLEDAAAKNVQMVKSDAFEAVSYTHLDVYKRQTYIRSTGVINSYST